MKLVLFFIFSLTFATALKTEAGITPVTVSEISGFHAEWCAPNQIILQDIKFVCYGTSDFNGESTRSVVVQRADQTRELFVEMDFSSVDMMNLEFGIVGPVASSKPREKFSRKYTGQVIISVDSSGEADSVSGVLGFGEDFRAVRAN